MNIQTSSRESKKIRENPQKYNNNKRKNTKMKQMLSQKKIKDHFFKSKKNFLRVKKFQTQNSPNKKSFLI